jgi:MoaE-MoaD fusion protein
LAQAVPSLSQIMRAMRVAVNHELVEDDRVLAEGDEIALIPPVSGGSGLEQCAIGPAPIDVEAMRASMDGEDAGAEVVFVGKVRKHSHGRTVSHLDYEAYDTMALRVLRRIASDLIASQPGIRMSIQHRTGRLTVGEVAIAIVVQSPHRDAAFRACRDAIERIKAELPIWKREVGPDGAEWVGMGS